MKIRSKMNELAWRHHFPIISLWEIFQKLKDTLLCMEWSNLAEIRTRQRFYACPRYLQVWKRPDKKQQRKGGDIVFPSISQWGAFCCHGNQSFDPICPKTLCSLSPALMMLHIKFDQDWPTGLRDFHLNYDGKTEWQWQIDRMTKGQGKSSIAPTFSKRGYKNY